MNGFKAALDSLLSILTGVVSIVASMGLASSIEKILIPNPCLYHSAEYLNGKETPWWIDTFFNLDSIGHPEAGLSFFLLCLILGTTGIYITLRKSTKAIGKWLTQQS